MKNLHIKNSYKTWTITQMVCDIEWACKIKYGTLHADETLNRNYRGMYIEWYLHNIGYWLTLPFIKNNKIREINNRFKHLDLEEHFKEVQ